MSGERRDERDPAEDHTALVAAGYDQIAEHYLATKMPLSAGTLVLLEQLLRDAPASSPVLDLGCGAGAPVTAWLARRRPTIGVDLSARQLALARRQAPGAAFLRADMATVEFQPASLGAVVACYSIIHLPRVEHGPLLARVYRWLQPGGGFLATWARGDWEGEEADWQGWGAPMWWSHFDGETNRALLCEAGFVLEHELTETLSADERWLWILARKPAVGQAR